MLRGQHKGPLFPRILKGGHITALGLTDQAIYEVLRKRAEQAGVDKFSPHDFRRTFAGDMLDAGVDLATVQKIMGHASATTTTGYGSIVL
ncbi:tyrosine-type recombinase/integrase [Chloroflexi bacterium TSY]|nr:tyrosine-type recombinase/integrase [Chloroflexi bacterium TSY]